MEEKKQTVEMTVEEKREKLKDYCAGRPCISERRN